MKESCYGFIILKYKTVVFSFIAYLGGHDACLHHVLTMISRLLPLCACSLILVISLDALINDVLHPCMIISAIALLVWSLPVFASLRFVLSMSSTRASNSFKNQSIVKWVHHIYLLAICYSKVHLTCFYLSFKLNSFGAMQKLVSKALTSLMAHFIFLVLKNLTLWLSYVELLCLQVISWKLAQPCRHRASFQYCTSYLSWYRDLLFMDTRDVK